MPETLGQRIARLRGRESQEEFAHRAGISRRTLQAIETGVTASPGIDKIKSIADALGVAVEVLISGQAPKKAAAAPLTHEDIRSELQNLRASVEPLNSLVQLIEDLRAEKEQAVRERDAALEKRLAKTGLARKGIRLEYDPVDLSDDEMNAVQVFESFFDGKRPLLLPEDHAKVWRAKMEDAIAVSPFLDIVERIGQLSFEKQNELRDHLGLTRFSSPVQSIDLQRLQAEAIKSGHGAQKKPQT